MVYLGSSVLYLAAVVTAAAAGGLLARRLRLPALLGMLAGGFALAAAWPGPAATAEPLSAFLRLAVLALLLIKAGVGLALADIRRAGGLALRLGVLPMLAEAAVVAGVGVFLFRLPLAAGVALGFLVAPVSPAIVIPGVLQILGRATDGERRVPAALLAGAPLDNMLAVVALGVTLDVALGVGGSGMAAAGRLLFEIGAGVLAGVSAGLLLTTALRARTFQRPLWALFFAWTLGGALIAGGRAAGFSFVLALLALGTTLRARSPAAASTLAEGLEPAWRLTQVALFGLIGAAVEPGPLAAIGGAALVTIAVGQLGRAGGSLLATAGSGLCSRARLACVLAYVPKATIQAAFATLPLDRGLPSGATLLAVAVLAIALTAPVGTLAIERGAAPLLARSGR